MKIKLLTTDPTLPNWKSLKVKHREILKALNASPSANFTAIDVELRLDLAKPEVAARGAIRHTWLDKIFLPYFNQGYDFTGLHFSMDGWTKAGIRPTLNGANPVDTDQIGEFYFRADEDTTKRYVTGGSRLNTYIQITLHEIFHEYFRGAGLPDITHQYHYSMGDIRMLAATLDWTLYRPELQIRRKQETIVELLQRKVIELLKKKVAQLKAKLTTNKKPTLPVPFVKITQAYGVHNPSLYPSTGYHWGLDLRASLGTPVLMPANGKIIQAGRSESLGYWMQISADNRFFIVPHLAYLPQVGKYKQGDTVAIVGTTGLMTAVHFHIEVWTEQMTNRIAQLKDRGFEVTEDPAVYFGLK